MAAIFEYILQSCNTSELQHFGIILIRLAPRGDVLKSDAVQGGLPSDIFQHQNISSADCSMAEYIKSSPTISSCIIKMINGAKRVKDAQELGCLHCTPGCLASKLLTY